MKGEGHGNVQTIPAEDGNGKADGQGYDKDAAELEPLLIARSGPQPVADLEVSYEAPGERKGGADEGPDETGRTIGEFGIGTNRGARISPNMLEAEKAFGTAHFAIGDSYGIGKNASGHHYDALVDKATIKAKGRSIARNGKFLI